MDDPSELDQLRRDVNRLLDLLERIVYESRPIPEGEYDDPNESLDLIYNNAKDALESIKRPQSGSEDENQDG